MVLLNANLYNGFTSITGSEIYDSVQQYTIIITISVLFVILVFFTLVWLGYFKKSTAAKQEKEKKTTFSKIKVKLDKASGDEQTKENNEPFIDDLKKRKERLRKLKEKAKNQIDKEMMIRIFHQKNKVNKN